MRNLRTSTQNSYSNVNQSYNQTSQKYVVRKYSTISLDSVSLSTKFTIFTSGFDSFQIYKSYEDSTHNLLVLNDSDIIEFGYRFIRPFSIPIKVIDNMFEISYPDFEIYYLGFSYAELKNYVINDLLFNWDSYVEESDDNLTLGAIKLKKLMKDTLVKVSAF